MTTAPDLYKQLRPFGLLAQKNAMAPVYRAMVLAPDHVRANGLFGRLRCDSELGLTGEAMVDATDLLQVLRSLPSAEFTMTVGDGALRWACGPAKGHLALLSGDVPAPSRPDQPGTRVTAEFSDGLDLGGLASGTSVVRANNLLGVQIINRGDVASAYASDNFSLSGCALGAAIGDGVVTLLPDAVDLLAAVIRSAGEAEVSHDASSLFCVAAHALLVLHQVPPLKRDLDTVLPATERETAMPLFREAVTAFLRRAEALAEEKALVEVSVEDGRTRLAFSEAAGSTEEFYMVEGGPKVTVAPVRIEAQRLARALKHADRMVFDHTENGVLLLRGPQGFLFAIHSRRGAP